MASGEGRCRPGEPVHAAPPGNPGAEDFDGAREAPVAPRRRPAVRRACGRGWPVVRPARRRRLTHVVAGGMRHDDPDATFGSRRRSSPAKSLSNALRSPRYGPKSRISTRGSRRRSALSTRGSRRRWQDLRTEQKTEIAGVRTEIAEVRTEIASLETRLIRWMVGTVLATATLTFGILRFLGG